MHDVRPERADRRAQLAERRAVGERADLAHEVGSGKQREVGDCLRLGEQLGADAAGEGDLEPLAVEQRHGVERVALRPAELEQRDRVKHADAAHHALLRGLSNDG